MKSNTNLQKQKRENVSCETMQQGISHPKDAILGFDAFAEKGKKDK